MSWQGLESQTRYSFNNRRAKLFLFGSAMTTILKHTFHVGTVFLVLTVVEAIQKNDGSRCNTGSLKSSNGSNNHLSRQHEYEMESQNINFGFSEKDPEEKQILVALERAGFFQVMNEKDYENTHDDDDDNEEGDQNATLLERVMDPHFSKTANTTVSYLTLPEHFQFQDDSAKFIFPQVHEPLATVPRALPVEPRPRQTKEPSAAKASMTSSMTTTSAWVRKFLDSRSKDGLFPLPRDYCADHFNHAHLPAVIEKIANHHHPAMSAASTTSSKPYPIYRRAYQLLIANDDEYDDEDDVSSDDDNDDEIPEYLERATEALYLLLHQRFILSPRGMDMVRRRFVASCKYQDPIFGRCPLSTCRGMPLLPIGESDHYSSTSRDGDKTDIVSCFDARAKRYCASCQLVFYFWDSQVDGCAWGTSFCHLFLLIFPEILGTRSPIGTSSDPEPRHVPRIYGFELDTQH
jgi:hypothetical protein